MSNYPLGADNKNAPWNQEEAQCPECKSTDLYELDSGYYKKHCWTNWRCLNCGIKIINEPDYED